LNRPHPSSTLFPYTTLFRSVRHLNEEISERWMRHELASQQPHEARNAPRRGDSAVRLPLDDRIGPVEGKPALARIQICRQRVLLALVRPHVAREADEGIRRGNRAGVGIVLGNPHTYALVHVQKLENLEPGEVEIVESTPDHE